MTPSIRSTTSLGSARLSEPGGAPQPSIPESRYPRKIGSEIPIASQAQRSSSRRISGSNEWSTSVSPGFPP